jgi:hypothetical protein
MVSCPYCGTLNRKGSNYCSSCGQQLDALFTVQCSACGAPNPAGDPSCTFCGAPLAHGAESDRMHPPSAPRSQPTPGEDTPAEPKLETDARAELPSWLYQQPTAKTNERGPSVAAALPATSSVADREPSNSLHGLRGVLKDEEGWLASSLGKYLAERASKH